MGRLVCVHSPPPCWATKKIHRPINSDGCRGCSSISWSKVILTIWSKLCCSHLSLSMRRTAHAQHSSTPLQCNLSGRARRHGTVEMKRMWFYTTSKSKP